MHIWGVKIENKKTHFFFKKSKEKYRVLEICMKMKRTLKEEFWDRVLIGKESDLFLFRKWQCKFQKYFTNKIMLNQFKLFKSPLKFSF